MNRVASVLGGTLIHDDQDQIVKLRKRRIEVPLQLPEVKIWIQQMNGVRIKGQVLHDIHRGQARGDEDSDHHPYGRSPAAIHQPNQKGLVTMPYPIKHGAPPA